MRVAFSGTDTETTALPLKATKMSHLIGMRMQELGLMVHNVLTQALRLLV